MAYFPYARRGGLFSSNVSNSATLIKKDAIDMIREGGEMLANLTMKEADKTKPIKGQPLVGQDTKPQRTEDKFITAPKLKRKRKKRKAKKIPVGGGNLSKKKQKKTIFDD